MMFLLYESGWLAIEDETGVNDTMYFTPQQTNSMRDFLNESWDEVHIEKED